MIPDTILSGKLPQEMCSMSKRKRSSFTTELKLEAVCLIVDQGYSYPEAYRAMDLIPNKIEISKYRNIETEFRSTLGGNGGKSFILSTY